MEEELDRLIQDKNKLLTVAGILHSQRAFCGPEVLHIDLTNWCNFDCIACWCRSPLLGDKAMPEWERKLIIPFDKIKGIFDDLSRMGGLRQVKLVGGGEPFMHPDIIKTVEYIKQKDKNTEIDINTNFSLVDEAKIDRLLDLGLDSFTVSLWAGSAQAYLAVHPNQDIRTFEKVRRVLGYLNKRKKTLVSSSPRVIIHNVVFKNNYKDIQQMIDFALEIGASDIQFVPVDPVKDKTECLLPNEDERKRLLEYLYNIKEKYDPLTFDYVSDDSRVVKLPDFEGFIRRIERFNRVSGAYDEDIVDEVPCYVGWLFARVMTTGDVVPCCKGHRMPMGNINKNSFKEVWLSEAYNEFRKNCIVLSKSDDYFSKIGNDALARTGCYNCDNLWQNFPMHEKLMALKNKYSHLLDFSSCILKSIFKNYDQHI